MPNTIVPAIQQRLIADADSICFKCFHRKVCRAIDNQPCIECNQFTDVNGVTVQQWIPVTERLPKLCSEEPEWTETVLFRTITGRIYSGFRNQGRPQTSFYDDDWYPPYWMDESEQIEVEDEYVTHWMPLPQPPKGDKEND